MEAKEIAKEVARKKRGQSSKLALRQAADASPQRKPTISEPEQRSRLRSRWDWIMVRWNPC